MTHRQHRDDVVGIAAGDVTLTEVDGCAEALVAQHHTLRVAGGTGSIVDDVQLLVVIGGIIDLRSIETVGELGIETFVEGGVGFHQDVVLTPEGHEVAKADDVADVGHLADVQLLVSLRVGEEDHAVGMIGKALDCLGEEVGEERDDHGLVRRDREERNSPVGGVLAAECYLVTFLDTGSLESEVDALDLSGEFTEGVLLPVVVAYCKFLPPFGHGLLQFAEVMFGSGSLRSFVHNPKLKVFAKVESKRGSRN